MPYLEAIKVAIADYNITLRDKITRPKSAKQGATQRGRKRKQNTVSVTVSMGIAEKTEKLTSSKQVLQAADKALYKAKQNGRNPLAR